MGHRLHTCGKITGAVRARRLAKPETLSRRCDGAKVDVDVAGMGRDEAEASNVISLIERCCESKGCQRGCKAECLA